MGGTSAEREVSLNSGGQVLEALKKAGCDVKAIDYQGDLASLQQELETCDRAFLAMHGRGGEDDHQSRQDQKQPALLSDSVFRLMFYFNGTVSLTDPP